MVLCQTTKVRVRLRSGLWVLGIIIAVMETLRSASTVPLAACCNTDLTPYNKSSLKEAFNTKSNTRTMVSYNEVDSTRRTSCQPRMVTWRGSLARFLCYSCVTCYRDIVFEAIETCTYFVHSEPGFELSKF